MDVFKEEAEQAGSSAPTAIGNVADAVVQFTKVELYNTFLAEYAFLDGDIVLHFFPPREAFTEVNGQLQLPLEQLHKWQQFFPAVLSPVAEEYFQATKPVVVAQYIPEMTSWWMRCGGFASRLGPDDFILKFLEKLDAALDAASARAVS